MRQITGRDIVHDETQHGGLECVPSILNVWPLENIKGNGMLRHLITLLTPLKCSNASPTKEP